MRTEKTERLTEEFTTWCHDNGHKPQSADELLASLQGDCEYLKTFCERWERAQDFEDNDEQRFQDWRSNRKWFHDMRDFCTDDMATGPGFSYPCGFILLNVTDRQDLGRYMTYCPFDVWGDLETVERALWDNHARAEIAVLDK